MLRSMSHLRSYNIAATDEVLGKVKDFLFDDRNWKVRYVAANTGKWLPGKRVLLSPLAVGEPHLGAGTLPVSLTKRQVQECPAITEDEPVSRRYERELHAYYGWAPYWVAPVVASVAPSSREGRASADEVPDQDPGLRSFQEVVGYHIAATDGDIGHVEDMILDEDGWWIRYVVVDTKNWLPGRKVLVSPQWVDWIRWSDRRVGVDMSREQVRESPEYDPGAPVNREYEVRLYDYYGRPGYWR